MSLTREIGTALNRAGYIGYSEKAGNYESIDKEFYLSKIPY
jgi:hypothetical protein